MMLAMRKRLRAVWAAIRGRHQSAYLALLDGHPVAANLTVCGKRASVGGHDSDIGVVLKDCWFLDSDTSMPDIP